ncbi:uncharacterized protein A4U43_C07F12170 [Asparagus officinalis]|uniref:Uncharacterized protein n=1 Tax=Asparagus officinalis TaxID=4686 RepID=A0A5P1EBI1_ASPOF|nr:uncharacterized protein A4U43_C07F12170 [Asparagus officinalis]
MVPFILRERNDHGQRSMKAITAPEVRLYKEWRGILGWRFDLHAFLAKSWKEQKSISFKSNYFDLGLNILINTLILDFTLSKIGRPAPEAKGMIDTMSLLRQRFRRRAGDMKELNFQFLLTLRMMRKKVKKEKKRA